MPIKLSARSRARGSKKKDRGAPRPRRSFLPRSWLDWVLAIVCVALIAFAISSIGSSSSGAVAGSRTATVDKGVVQSTVSGNGSLEAAEQVELNFGASGEVTAIEVKAGEEVKKGQVLARIDSSSARASLASAEAQLSEAEESLESAEEAAEEEAEVEEESEETAADYEVGATTVLAGYMVKQEGSLEEEAGATGEAPVESEAAPKEAEAAPGTTKETEAAPGEKGKTAGGEGTTGESKTAGGTTGGRQTEAPAEGGKTEAPTAGGETEVPSAKGGEAAPTEEAETTAAPATGTSAGAAASGTVAESSAPAGGEEAAAVGGGGAVSVPTAEANLREAQLSVKSARQKVRETTLRAPISGTIASISGAVGENVSGEASGASATGGASEASTAGAFGATGGGGESSSSGSAFIVVAQLQKLKMEVSFSESDIGKVKVGQTATVSVDSLEGTELAGHVTKVDVLPSESSSSVVEYPATILLTQSAEGLRAGMSASAEVVVEQVKDAVAVSSEAITDGPTKTVTVKEGSKEVEKTVTTGLVGDETTQIVSGLKAGETVVLPEATVAGAGEGALGGGETGGFPGATGGGFPGGGFSGGPPAGFTLPGGGG